MGKKKKKDSEPLKNLQEYVEIRKRLYPLISEKIIAYVRVSSEASAKSDLSIPEQLDKIKEFIKGDKELSKYIVNNELTKDVIIIEDKAESGLEFENRPGLQEILDIIKKKNISHLLVYKVDRIGRSIKQNADIHDELKKKGIHIISVTEKVIDTRDNDCELYFALLSMFARIELNNIKERTMAANIRRMKQGFAPPGNPAFGFRRTWSDEYNGNVFEINKKEAKIVKELFDLAAIEVTNADISKIIYMKYKLLLSTSRLLRIIRNPIYKGQVKYGDYVKEKALFKGIVRDEIWEKANSSRKTYIRNKDDQLYLKRHLFPDRLKCPLCSGDLQCKNSKSTKGGQTIYYRYYICKSSRKDNDKGLSEDETIDKEYCSFKKIPAELLETFIIYKFIEDIELNNSYDSIKKIHKIIFESMADFLSTLKDVDLKVRRGALDRNIRLEERKLENLRNEYYGSEISENEYKKRKEIINKDISEYNDQLKEIMRELENEDEETKEIKYTIANKYYSELEELNRLITYGYSLQIEKNKFRQYFILSINKLINSINLTSLSEQDTGKIMDKYDVDFQYTEHMPKFDMKRKGKILSLGERMNSYQEVIRFVLDSFPDSTVSTVEEFAKKHDFK